MQHTEKKDFFEFLLQRSEGFTSYFTPIFDSDRIVDYSVLFLTDNFEQLIKTNPQNLITKNVSEIYPAFFKNGMLEIFNSCILKKEFEISFERELEFCGETYWFENRAISYKNGIILNSRNTSRTKKIETKLRKLLTQVEYQNNILKDSESISKTASFRWHIRENTWHFSDSMSFLLDHFKVSKKNRKTNGIFELLKNKSTELLNEAIHSFEYYKKITPIEFQIRDSKGYIAYYSLNGNFYPTKNGPVFLGVLVDVTNNVKNQLLLKNKNNDLKKSYAELESFSHVVSHDLQEPLRKIQMFISRIDDFSNTDKVEKMIHKIEETSNRMQHLIKNMLYYSSISDPKSNFQKIELHQIIESCLTEYNEQLSQNNFKIEVSVTSSIKGDVTLLKQLFSNLISNAIKYKSTTLDNSIQITEQPFTTDTLFTDSAKKISAKNYIKILFSDNGIGFEQQYATKIFKIFQRLHDKNKYSGTGVGLAICNKIIKIHNGFIDVESSPNKGAKFYLYFPKKNT